MWMMGTFNEFRRNDKDSRAVLLTVCFADLPYILESNPHRFYSFRGLKNQMRIRIACGLDSLS